MDLNQLKNFTQTVDDVVRTISMNLPAMPGHDGRLKVELEWVLNCRI